MFMYCTFIQLWIVKTGKYRFKIMQTYSTYNEILAGLVYLSRRSGRQESAASSVHVLVDVLLGVDDDAGVARLRGVLGVGGSGESAARC